MVTHTVFLISPLLLCAVGFDDSFVFDIGDDVTSACVSLLFCCFSVYSSISFEMIQIYFIFLF
jgi:hypothetical protein